MNDTIKHLPPAQPEPCEDAVSRKAVQYLLAHFVDEDKYIDACDGLKHLPPAQPEIIRCKDCKQFRRWIDTDICFCDITESERSEDDFCSRAEKEKRN